MAFHRSLIGAACALVLVACSAAAEGPSSDATVESVSGTGGSIASAAPDGSGGPASDAADVSDPAAAGDAADDTDPSDSGPGTVPGVGNLPGPLPTDDVEEIASTTTLPPPEEEVGSIADGNRILMLGDSILASTARRYTNTMCRTLVPLGWQVQLEAEVSRGIDFGQRVIRELDDLGWDVGLIFLGNNYNDDQQDFFKRYNEVILGFGGVPVVVVTVTEFEPAQAEVNEIIHALAGAHPNVTVLDWAQISTFPGVIADHDPLKLHLTDEGRQVLADAVAAVLGQAPAQPGDCLRSRHTDDSAGSVNGGGTGSSGGSGGSGGRPPTSTNRPTQTTARPTQTTSGGTTAPTSGCQIPPCPTSPPNTNPPGTNPPVTNPPATNPPATNPPATNPPATNPPATNLPATNPPTVTTPPPPGP